MVVIPKDKPVIENLNSYYVNMKRLLEHYQDELGAGGLYLKSASSEGAIFFEKDAVLGGILKDREGETSGKTAVDRMMREAEKNNYTIDVYQIDPEKIYFWASIPAAKKIYRDLSTEFTDLVGLINKMSAEKLTGFIEASMNGDKERGFLFFYGGQFIGGSYSWERGGLEASSENRERLIEKTKKVGGVFHVSKISAEEDKKGDLKATDREKAAEISVIEPLEALLARLEDIVKTDKKNRAKFNILLRKKFVEMADRFAFLDPFAAEFEYSDRKIFFHGEASDKDLIEGVVTAVKELAEEWGVFSEIKIEASHLVIEHGKGLLVPGINA